MMIPEAKFVGCAAIHWHMMRETRTCQEIIVPTGLYWAFWIKRALLLVRMYFTFGLKQSIQCHSPSIPVSPTTSSHSTKEYMIIPIINLHKVPSTLTDEVAVFAEPLAAACRVVEQGLVQFMYSDEKRRNARGGDRVAILGDGKLGLCVAEILGREYISCTNHAVTVQKVIHQPKLHVPILFGKHQRKLDLVSNSGVQTKLVSECYTDNTQSTVSPAHMNQYDVVIDATGSPTGLTLAMSLCRPMGILVLKSTCASGVAGFHSAPIVIDELKVVGSRCGPIDGALELLSKETDGNIPPLEMKKYITKTYPLSQVKEALACAREKSTMKVQLVMEES